DAVDAEFVSLGLATEDGMVLEDQTARTFPHGLSEVIRRAQSAQPATDDDEVEDLAGIGHFIGQPVIRAIPDPVGCFEHRSGVPIGSGVVTNAPVAGPRVFLMRAATWATARAGGQTGE